MAIYRGTGGAGDATNDATVSEVTQKALDAQNSATAAAESASEAATSASTATTKATEASVSASTATTQAAGATTSASNAAGSEATASTKATEAASSASEAATSLANATVQASNASTSATNAATSESNASASASAAATSETNAGNSATAAASSESNAATSESNASTSASAAETAKTAAEAAQTAAEAVYDNFDDRYLGAKTAHPTVDNDGDALTEGVIYWNTTTHKLYIYNGTAWSIAVLDTADALINSSNLSDVSNVATARDNLGLGATDDVTFATLSPNYIDFATDQDPAHSEGRLFYDNTYKSLSFYNDESDITLQIGQEFYYRVYNNSGATIANGTPVYFSGNHSTNPTVAPADATDAAKYNVQGLATHDIENNSYGMVTAAGSVSGFDTSHLTAGAPVFLGTTEGTTSSTSASYPNYPMYIGTCTVSSTDGTVYVNQQNHSVNTFRVVNSAHIGQDLLVSGDLTVTGTQTATSSNNVSLGASFQYLNAGDTIGETNTSHTGTGLDDVVLKGHYSGTTSSKTFKVKITTAGTPDKFRWSTDDFATQSAEIDVDGTEQDLEDGIKVEFATTTGHTVNDVWSGTATPTNVDTGFFTNYNTGASGVGYTHTGFFWDASALQWTLLDAYDPEPEGTIDTSDSSVVYGTLKLGEVIADVTGDVTGNVTGNVTGDVTGNVTGSLVNAGTTRVEPTATGVTVTGTLTATAYAGDGSGLTGVAGVPSGIIVMWSGAVDSLPSGWVLCDGTNSTPDLRDRFVIGAGNTYAVAASGGSADSIVPSHTHTGSAASAGAHTHTGSAADAGSHSHSGSTASAGNHRHSWQEKRGDVNWNSGNGNSSWGNATRTKYTGYAGSHSHSLSISAGGTHSHSVTINSNGDHSHSLTINSTGSSATGANLPPYYALAYIMKS